MIDLLGFLEKNSWYNYDIIYPEKEAIFKRFSLLSVQRYIKQFISKIQARLAMNLNLGLKCPS